MATLSKQIPSAAGTSLTYAAAGGSGDKFVNTGREFIHVKNASGSSINVTISSGTNKCSFGITNAAHDMVVAVAAAGDKMIGPFSVQQFNDANNAVNVSYSLNTSVTVAVISNS
jgi:hypothetical protein